MKDNKKIIISKWIAITGIILLALLSTMELNMSEVFGQAQDTCPDGGEWIKVDDLDGFSYTYTAPEGKLVAETCYKAGNFLENELIDPPEKTVTVTSTVQFELSHASFRLVDEPTPTPTPTDEPTPTPTDEPTPTPTDEPTPTPTDEPTPTPTDEPTPTPTEEQELDPLLLAGECIDIDTIEWVLTNNNDFSIDFTWVTNPDNGSGTVPGNGAFSFTTSDEITSITVSYMLGGKAVELSEQVTFICAEETEEPTPQPTPEETEEPTPQPTPQPTPVDEPAGGSGPSPLSIVAPILILVSGLGLTSVVLLNNKKKSQSNN